MTALLRRADGLSGGLLEGGRNLLLALDELIPDGAQRIREAGRDPLVGGVAPLRPDVDGCFDGGEPVVGILERDVQVGVFAPARFDLEQGLRREPDRFLGVLLLVGAAGRHQDHETEP